MPRVSSMNALEPLRVFPPPLAEVEIDYPVTDDQPMPDADYQEETYLYGRPALKCFYRHRPDVYVSGNLFIYYREGEPKKVVAPDVFVVFGVEKKLRDTYKVWEEGAVPSFVLEIISPSTHRTDVGEKKEVYAGLGVQEYWLFDPRGRYLEPVLQGYRLGDGGYEPISGARTEPYHTARRSEVLGLEVRVVEEELRFFDPEKGEYLRTFEESEAEREAERRARAEAEARVAELEARLRALSGA